MVAWCCAGLFGREFLTRLSGPGNVMGQSVAFEVPHMKRFLLLLPLLICLSSCESTDPAGADDAAVPGGASSLRTVAGLWRFSHFGLPTVSNEDLPDPAKVAKEYLRGTTISLKENGEGAAVFSGQASAFQAKVLEETDLYIKIGLDDQPAAEALVYDKGTKLLMMPTKLELGGSNGILPTYFKRGRSRR